MDRFAWFLLALVLLLGAVYLHVHEAADWVTFTTAGVGAGIVLALTGSLIHDAFSAPRSRP